MMTRRLLFGSLLAIALFQTFGCKPDRPAIGSSDDKQEIPLQQGPLMLPNWAINANIYEVNLRQYTPEGTIKAFEAHLPRLKELGVDILWFMPVQPISEVKRKGGLGSFYSIADYKAVHPDHGTMDEFKALVQKIHDMGMYVVLDWVANHTGWDHTWISAHPEWYMKNGDTIRHAYDNEGKPTDWYDVADLDYSNQAMRREMISDMRFWLDEVGIDGFRCDVAGFVPVDFWKEARVALDSVRPVFMLAEWEYEPAHFDVCFNMNYGWHFHHLLNEISQGKRSANSIDSFLREQPAKFPEHYFQMHFVTNHDENSWKGTASERMGQLKDAMTVLAFTLEGMPLIYSGQEAGETKKLSFFEKDTINWSDLSDSDLLGKLLRLKHENRALWNGPFGGKPVRINEGPAVYAFERQKDGDAVVVVVNLTNSPQTTTLDTHYHGLVDVISGETVDLHNGEQVELPPAGYRIWSGKEYTGGGH